MRITRLLATAATAALVPLAAQSADMAVADLVGTDGKARGQVTLTEGPNGVLVQVRAANLDVGEHGFHIHQTGSCEPDFGAAGGHYNPADSGHGFLHPDGPHAGDLPNIHAGATGNAHADVFTDAVTLAADADNTLFDDDGSAIIIHENPDSYGAEAGAGGRVACGVIERQ